MASELFAARAVGRLMTYRDDARETLLRERCASLESELSAVKARRETEKTLRSREEELRAELARLRIDLARTDRKLPMLATVRVASPCSAKWDDMIGDEKTRFCGSCTKNVHNLSAMSAAEAEALLQHGEATNAALCVRYFQRTDGTILTQDCPVGVKRKRLRRFAALAIGAGAAGAAVTSFLTTLRAPTPCFVHASSGTSGGLQGAVAMGDIAPPSLDPPTLGSAAPIEPPPPPEQGRFVAGGIRAMPPPPVQRKSPKKAASASQSEAESQ